jgi:hypothetical protein
VLELVLGLEEVSQLLGVVEEELLAAYMDYLLPIPEY